MLRTCILLSFIIVRTRSQFVPDNDDYQDDLSFLDVAIDRGENAMLCDHLMKMAYLANIVLIGIVILVWGFCGESVGHFYSRQKPKTPEGRRKFDDQVFT